MTKADNIEVPLEDAWSPWSPDELYERIEDSDLIWAVSEAGRWTFGMGYRRDLEFIVLQKQPDECRPLLAGLRFYSVRDGVLTH